MMGMCGDLLWLQFLLTGGGDSFLGIHMTLEESDSATSLLGHLTCVDLCIPSPLRSQLTVSVWSDLAQPGQGFLREASSLLSGHCVNERAAYSVSVAQK